MPSKSAILSDPTIRREVKYRLASDDSSAFFIDELSLSRREGRADLAAINGHLSGFEIKSALDSLTRLNSQIPKYERVFEFCHVVTTEKHLHGVLDLLPDRWGIRVATMRGDDLCIDEVRPASLNPNISTESVIRLLWKPDVVRLLTNMGQRASKSVPVCEMWAQLRSIDEATLMEAAKQALRSRATRPSAFRRMRGGDSLTT